MIQRIQSIFLLLVVVCMSLTLVMPVWEKQAKERSQTLTVFGLEDTQEGKTTKSAPTIYLPIIAIVAAVVSLASIFMFRNRLRQMQMGMLNSLLMSVLLALLIWRITEANKIIEGASTYHIGFWLVAASMLFNLAANRFIRKDEKLVRAADRIR